MSLDSSMWIWLPLCLAIIFAFCHQTKLSIAFIAVSLIGGFIESKINTIGLITLGTGLTVAYRIPTLQGRWKLLGYLFVVLWSAALFLHLIPGFSNAKVLDAVTAGERSIPFTMHLNLDKPFVFFGLLFAYPSLFGSKEVFNKKAILYSAVPLFSLLLIAWWIALYRPSFHCQVGGGCFC